MIVSLCVCSIFYFGTQLKAFSEVSVLSELFALDVTCCQKLIHKYIILLHYYFFTTVYMCHKDEYFCHAVTGKIKFFVKYETKV